MTTPAVDELKMLLAPLGEAPIGVESSEEIQRCRDKVLPALQDYTQRMVRRQRHKRWALGAGGVLAVAAGILLGVGVWQGAGQVASGDVALIEGKVMHDTRGVAEVSAGSGPSTLPLFGELRTSAGSARLETSAGVELELAPRSQASLAKLDEAKGGELELRSGGVKCEVPPVAAGKHFAVRTPNALVVVHGTVFSVMVDRNQARQDRTCVDVSEGVVSVTGDGRAVRLTAGQSWCSSPKEMEPKVDAETERTSAATSAGEVPAAGKKAQPAPMGTLAEEVLLLKKGVSAEERGELGIAQRYYSQLAVKYPKSSLAREARSALKRLAAKQE